MAKATAKSGNQNLTTTDDKPSYLQELEKKGGVQNQDNFDQSDIVIPRVKLLQALSEEVESFDEAKAGIFWHTGFDAPLGPELDFVVCSRKKKYLLVAPLEDGQGILARSEDFVHWDRTGSWDVKIKGVKSPVTWEISDANVSRSGLDQWGTSNPDDPESPPAATLFYEYLVLLPDHLEFGPAVLSLTRSQIKKAKKGLNDKIRLHESAGRPMQSIVFRAKVVDDKNSDGNAYKNWQFVGNGFAAESLYSQAVDLSDALRDYKVQDEESAAGEDQPATSDAESKEF